MRKYLFYITGFILVLVPFAFSNKTLAANPDCIGSFCVDTEVSCYEHYAIVHDYISPGLIGMENVSCYENNGYLGSGAYNYTITN